MASTSDAGQKKIKSSDGQTIFRPAPGPVSPGIFPFEDLLEIPRVSPHEDLITLSTPDEPSSESSHLPYHVFINHCGQDTKHNIASSIYNELSRAGLRVFLDKAALQTGDFFPHVLKEAIVKASLHIAIFSKNYAQSHWCLRELELMLQTQATFIPVFYDIEPETLRCVFYGKGDYASALDEYTKKNRYSISKLENWRDSLHKASFHVGVKINHQCGQEEGVKNVVTSILEGLKKMRLDVAKHPVALERWVQDFENIALQSMGPVQIVGIWGMGGAGKTTLAKHLYNKKCTKKSSFLFDVRDAAFKGRLHEKQKKLIEDLDLKVGIANLDNKEVGKGILRNCLESVPVLIVLDDVDHVDQLDALIPARETLGHGSLIIVTTREFHVLEAWDISAIYKIKQLDSICAEELFCWHAFGQPSAFIDFKELAKEVADACCCLPLSLKVLGSLLHGKSSKEYWQAQLNQLSRIIPEDINSRLKISYDNLKDEEKEMFLDVACFFIGWSSSSTIAIWDGSEWSGLLGWESLVNKCLVEIEDNKIRMHDHLRDLGREIANEQSPYRIWSKTQKIKIHPLQKAIQIRGMANAFGNNCSLRAGKIRLKTSEGERKLKPGSLGLKILIGGGDFTNDECSEIYSELLCFHCDHKTLSSWLPLKELRILQLLQLEDLWECEEDALPQLRQLQIGGCYGLKKISGLRRLKLLQTLEISLCGELKTLPSLAGLTSLKEIELTICQKLEKIESLEGLTSLQKIRICHCCLLDSLPSLAGLTSLKEIELWDCGNLKIESLEGLASLQKIRIGNCFAPDILPGLAGLTSLKEIELDCGNFKKGSLEGLRALEKFKIYGCPALHTLPSLAGLTSLKEIELTRCKKLEKIESLGGLRALEKLKIHSCTELKSLPSLAGLTSLKEIELTGCEKLENIESLEGFRTLEKLKIHGCPALDTLGSLAGLTSLKEIELKCGILKIESLEGLRALEMFKIDDCPALHTLPSLAELTSLKEIELTGCKNLEKIESLGGLRALEMLKIRSCPALHTLPSLVELTSLEVFELTGCQKVDKVEGLEELTSLKELKVHMCSMRPCVLKLPGQSERLRSVEVVGNRAVVEPFIRDIQKWPREEIILTRTMIDVMSLRKFFTSSLREDVVQTSSSQYRNPWGCVTLRMPEAAADANGILICTILESTHTDLRFRINMWKSYSYTEMINVERVGMDILPQQSIWVWMGIFPHQSHCLSSQYFHIIVEEDEKSVTEEDEENEEDEKSVAEKEDEEDEKKVVKNEERIWLLRGTEQSIREAFLLLSQS